MKFVCLDCDRQMAFEERAVPGDGTLTASFRCPTCGRAVAMLANPYETQLVSSLGVKIGGSTIGAAEPMSLAGEFLAPPPEAPGGPRWDPAAAERLGRVPSFVRGMVKRIYADWAREHGIAEITTAVMDRARTDLGLEGM
ncbi:MAG TPA: PCP reductase family protein [Gemmatimonadales bacterium]|nr:PCP reductase family protein [Gemmatimonadales bacterium]